MVAKFFNDSKGRTHYVLMQEKTMSCGPASVAMVESYYKKMCMIDPEGRARQISQNYPGKFTEAGGTQVDNLSYVLNAEGIKAYAAVKVSAIFNYLWFYVRERTSVIAHIGWTAGGGHFSICRIVDPDGTCVFLDPYYGVVEVARANLPTYSPQGSSGQLSGWIVVTYL
jgi:hypothetical protein